MKGFLYILLFLMVFACPSWAYEENFDSGEAVGWVANTGNWYVDDDVYVCGMGGANEYAFFEEGINNTDWTDYTFEVQVNPVAGSYAGVLFRVQEPGNGGGAWTTGKFYYWLIGVTPDGGNGYSIVWKGLGGGEGSLNIAGDTLKQDEWNDVKVELSDGNVKIYLRGELQKEFAEKDLSGGPWEFGGIGLAAYTAEVQFDNIRVLGPGIPGMAVDYAGKAATTWGNLKSCR